MSTQVHKPAKHSAPHLQPKKGDRPRAADAPRHLQHCGGRGPTSLQEYCTVGELDQVVRVKASAPREPSAAPTLPKPLPCQ